MSDQDKVHRCDECGRPGAFPKFTKSVIGPRNNPQPRWFCNLHWGLYKEVTYDGVPMKSSFPGTLIHKRQLKVVA